LEKELDELKLTKEALLVKMGEPENYASSEKNETAETTITGS
jgi:hypothetical protein